MTATAMQPCAIFYTARGKEIEVLASYEPCYTLMCEWWWKQLGESEGKRRKGLFPASVIFSTDLHSMGNIFSRAAVPYLRP